MRLLTDITPLREHPAFRRLWLGGMLSATGSAMTTFAVSLQVYDLTRSPAAVGGIGLAALIPVLLLTVPGGAFADRVDRRRLVLAGTVAQAAQAAALFTLTAFGGASLWALYALVAAGSAISAVNGPARRTFIPRLVPREQRATAMTLNRIVFQVVMIAGPALDDAGNQRSEWRPGNGRRRRGDRRRHPGLPRVPVARAGRQADGGHHSGVRYRDGTKV